MGMFDDITYEAPCPICQAPVTGWQSKQGPCVLNQYTPREFVTAVGKELPIAPRRSSPVHFYTSCKECDTWVTVQVEVKA